MNLPPPGIISDDAYLVLTQCFSIYPIKLTHWTIDIYGDAICSVSDAADPYSDGTVLIAGDCGDGALLFTNGNDYWFGYVSKNSLIFVNTPLHPLEIESFNKAIQNMGAENGYCNY